MIAPALALVAAAAWFALVLFFPAAAGALAILAWSCLALYALTRRRR